MSSSLYHLITMQNSNSKLPVFSRTLVEVSHSHPFYLFLSTASQQAVQSCYSCILHPVPNAEDNDITYIFFVHKVSEGDMLKIQADLEQQIVCAVALIALMLCMCIAALSTEILSELYRS